MYGCVRMCAPSVAPRHVACLVAAIWLHAIRVPPSKALALANMAGEEKGGVWGEGGEMRRGDVWRGGKYGEGERGSGTGPQVNFFVLLISCNIHSLVKRDVKRNDSPSRVMQSDAVSRQLT